MEVMYMYVCTCTWKNVYSTVAYETERDIHVHVVKEAVERRCKSYIQRYNYSDKQPATMEMHAHENRHYKSV